MPTSRSMGMIMVRGGGECEAEHVTSELLVPGFTRLWKELLHLGESSVGA